MALAKRTDKQFCIRMPHAMHAQLVAAADRNSRSINSEITVRLARSLFADANPESLRGIVADAIKARVAADTNGVNNGEFK